MFHRLMLLSDGKVGEEMKGEGKKEEREKREERGKGWVGAQREV